MKVCEIKVASEFAKMPIVRLRVNGPFSGEAFREDFLLPALQENDKVIVDLNGVLSLGSSFLEEAFGGLIRKHGYSFNGLKDRLEIKFELQSYVDEAWKSMKEARRG